MAAGIVDTLSHVGREYRILEKTWEAEKPIEKSTMLSVLLNEYQRFTTEILVYLLLSPLEVNYNFIISSYNFPAKEGGGFNPS